MKRYQIAVLDDYQNVAFESADWSMLRDRADITVFQDHVDDADGVVTRLLPFDIVCVMRERTPLPRSIIERLPNLKLISSTGPVNAAIDVAAVAKLDVAILDDKQSAHLKITGTLADGSYSAQNGELAFERTVRGLRNTVLLPAGWDASAVSQSATIGTYGGRAFVALINLNAENSYKVTIRARKRS